MAKDTKQTSVIKTSDFEIKETDIPIEVRDLKDMIETTTVIPTKTPTKFFQQFKIYLDDIASPTVKRFYIYSNKSNAWYYIALT